jgi:hypothetical protein
MPHTTEPDYKYIHVTQLGKTFTAEVSGCDFSKPISPDIFAEIHRAITEIAFSGGLLRVGIPLDGYRGHSFRKGAVQEAHNDGLTQEDPNAR